MLIAALALTGCGKTRTSDEDVVVVREDRVLAALNEPETVILDVRRAEAYDAGHLPRAINIPLPELRQNDPRLEGAQEIIVYAQDVADPLSRVAAKRLIAMGYEADKIFEFKGGVDLWRRLGQRLIGSPARSGVRPDTDR